MCCDVVEYPGPDPHLISVGRGRIKIRI
jgi:hypothetical protein